jgi:hypothetical protein
MSLDPRIVSGIFLAKIVQTDRLPLLLVKNEENFSHDRKGYVTRN